MEIKLPKRIISFAIYRIFYYMHLNSFLDCFSIKRIENKSAQIGTKRHGIVIKFYMIKFLIISFLRCITYNE